MRLVNHITSLDDTVFQSNLSHQRDSAVPHRTAPHYAVCDRILKNTIVTLFVTFTVTFIVTFYPVTRTVTPIVTLNCNGKYDRYTYRYRYYRYRT